MQLSKIANPGGADRDRTDDIQLAKLALSQLSYGPSASHGGHESRLRRSSCPRRDAGTRCAVSVVGLGRFELPTPRLSSVCSNQLSYRPLPRPCAPGSQRTKRDALGLSKPDGKPTKDCGHRLTCCCSRRRRREKLLRKEVIQPQVPLRLPCYDFTPVTSHSLGAAFPCGLGKPPLEQLTPMV